MSAAAPPTDQTYVVLDELSAELDAELAELDTVLDSRLDALNQALGAEGIEPVTCTPLKVEEDG